MKDKILLRQYRKVRRDMFTDVLKRHNTEWAWRQKALGIFQGHQQLAFKPRLDPRFYMLNNKVYKAFRVETLTQYALPTFYSFLFLAWCQTKLSLVNICSNHITPYVFLPLFPFNTFFFYSFLYTNIDYFWSIHSDGYSTDRTDDWSAHVCVLILRSV